MADALKLLGLIYKAKKMLLGEEVLNHIDKVELIILASDISDKSRDRYIKKSTYYKIDVIDTFTSQQMSDALGKKVIKVIGITDKGFKKALLSKI